MCNVTDREEAGNCSGIGIRMGIVRLLITTVVETLSVGEVVLASGSSNYVQKITDGHLACWL